MIYPKIYFGPMSKNIVDVLLHLSNEYPIGFIPSRRQIEHDGGYVNNWTSKDFYDYVKNKNQDCFVCRDHGGRLQGKALDDGEESFIADSSIGFDILHVDPWKKFESIAEAASETSRVIKRCLSINPQLKFEIGTEEAIHRYTSDELRDFLKLVKSDLGEDFKSVVYAVVQFGTRIIGTKNVGVFDRKRAKRMIEVVKEFSLLSKEHNGDYLTLSEVDERFELGLDAINIAPEFGTLESTIMINILIDNLEMKKLEKFFEICYNSEKWVKWIPYVKRFKNVGETNFYDFLICKVSGHYNFSHPEVEKWKEEMNIDSMIRYSLEEKIERLLRHTYEGK